MATELVKPTSTATKPAVKAERLRSLKNCIRGFWQGWATLAEGGESRLKLCSVLPPQSSRPGRVSPRRATPSTRHGAYLYWFWYAVFFDYPVLAGLRSAEPSGSGLAIV